MAKVLYFILTFLESGLAVFGIRSPFEEAPYRVEASLGGGVEIRHYGPRVAAETTGEDGDAFSRLFRYISGANVSDRRIAMTTPVAMRGFPGAAADGAGGQGMTMRFFLPQGLAADPPAPTDPGVKIVAVPSGSFGVIRFSGRLNASNVARHAKELEAALARAGRTGEGPPIVLGYDPPFTIPFLRRNEVAVALNPAGVGGGQR